MEDFARITQSHHVRGGMSFVTTLSVPIVTLSPMKRGTLSTALLSLVRHFLSCLVVLLALADGRFREGDAHNSSPFEAACNGSIESVHVFGEEPLADNSKTLDFLFAVGHQLCLSNGSG